MKYSTRIKSISYLKANAAEIVRELAEQHEPLVITQNGEAKAVIQDVSSYEATQETLALLRFSPWATGRSRKARWFLQPTSSGACEPRTRDRLEALRGIADRGSGTRSRGDL